MIDSSYDDDEDKSWIPTATAHVLQAIEKCWHKIQFPPGKDYNEWDSVDMTGFSDARRDVADLLQSSFTLIGHTLIEMFASLTLQSVKNHAWKEL